jgi:hypothetical protein
MGLGKSVFSETYQTEVDNYDLEAIRRQIGRWLSGRHGAALAAILAAQRGPDSPSERPDMGPVQHDQAYWGRRARKASSGEIVRSASFFGIGKVGARSRSGDSITLPPRSKWDHYDKHQAQAAQVLGIKVIESEDAPSAIKAEWKGGKYGD